VANTVDTVNGANESPGNHQQLQQQPKKFRSHKNRLQVVEKEMEKEKSEIVNGSAINVTRTNSKLKPVKERRPTALPTEAPNVDDGAQRGHSDGEKDFKAVDDVVDGKSKLKLNVNGIIDESDGSDATPSTATPTITANVKFFIGHTQELNVERHNDDTLSCHSNDANNNNHNKLRNGTLKLDQQGSEYEHQWMESTSLSSMATTIPTAPAKSYSNVSLNYLRRSKSTIANEPTTPSANTQRRRVSTMPDINIPTPPPMPVELLKPVTPLHLRKKRSAERQRELQQFQEKPLKDATLHASHSQVCSDPSSHPILKMCCNLM